MAQPEYTTYPEVVAWWRLNPDATIYKCKKDLQVSAEKAAEAKAEAAATRAESPVTVPPTRAEGTYTPLEGSLVIPTGTAPASGPARAPEREGTSNLTRAIEGETSRVVVASDFHFPDENTPLVQKWLSWLATVRVDRLVLLGDVMDAMSVSRFLVEDEVSLEDEVARTNAFLDQVTEAARAVNPACHIDFLEGNHEERITRYLYRNAGKLVGLQVDGEPVVGLPHLLRLRERRISHYRYQQVIRLPGNLWLEHGDSVSVNSAATVMNAVRRKGGSIVIGHVHRIGAYYKKDRDGFHRGYEIGAMCSLEPRYMTAQSANWQNGWAVIDYLGGTDKWWLTQVVVQDGKFVWEGRVY
jgi:predicted phosphodiesterase